jgi:hypothetical protein
MPLTGRDGTGRDGTGRDEKKDETERQRQRDKEEKRITNNDSCHHRWLSVEEIERYVSNNLPQSRDLLDLYDSSNFSLESSAGAQNKKDQRRLCTSPILDNVLTRMVPPHVLYSRSSFMPLCHILLGLPSGRFTVSFSP